MLMQSALSCDSRKFLGQPYYRGLSPTPPPSSDSISGSLLGVSRKLQTLLNVSPGPAPSTPPRSVRLASPFHQDAATITAIRKPLTQNKPPAPNKTAKTRSRKPSSRSVTPRLNTLSSPSSTSKAPYTPPRTRSKRSRSVYEDDLSEAHNRFVTPKRARRLPYNMPLGLGIADFEALDEYTCASPGRIPQQNILQQIESDPVSEEVHPQLIVPSIEVEDTEMTADWTAEEDEKLVGMVLEKFKLSQHEWEECARRIGKDDASVGKRWQALLGKGNIGLRRGSGPFVRGRLDGCFDEQQCSF